MRATVAAIALALVAALVAFGALADTGSNSTCAQYGSGGAQYDQYGNPLPPCPATTSGSDGAQYGEYGGTPAPVGLDNRIQRASVPGSTDSVAATDALAGTRTWSSAIENLGTASLMGPEISLDTSSLTFTPPLTFPLHAGPGPDLAPDGTTYALDALDTTHVETTLSPGFDATRSVTPATVPAGGGVQDVTVTLTVRDPQWTSGASLVIRPNDPSLPYSVGASIVPGSVVLPALGDGETINPAFTSSGGDLEWGIFAPVLDKTYTLQFQMQVPNGGTDPIAYKPFVEAEGSNSISFSNETGTSTTIADSVLGGTFTYAAATSETWQRQIDDYSFVDFAEVAPPPTPQAQASDQRTRSLDFGSGTDSVGATDTSFGELGWRGVIQNFETTPVTAPEISLDTSSQTFTPPVTFPLHAGPGSDLGQSQSLELNDISAQCCATSAVEGASIQTGYDASRSFDTTSIPAGGGDQTVTVSITPRDAGLANGWASLQVGADWYGGSAATIDTSNVVTSTLTGGEFAGAPFVSAQNVFWQVNNVQQDQTYTLTVHVHVANSGATPIEYKPMVILHAGHDAFATPATGASTTLADPVLGGTFTFSAGTSTEWTTDLADIVETNFEPVSPPSYTVAVDQPEVTVHAGGSFGEHATVSPLAGYAGQVNFFLSSGPDTSGQPSGWPAGFYQGGPWPQVSIGPGDGAADLPVTVDSGLAPGDYTIDVTTSSNPNAPYVYVPLTVHVLAPLPAAYAADYRNAYADLAGSVDSVTSGSSFGGWRGWSAQIYNQDAAQTIPGAQISLDGTTQPFTPAAGPFPLVSAPTDLAPGSSAAWDALDGWGGHPRVNGATVTPGFDLTRSVLPATVPAGGGTETLTLSVTPRDPSLGYLALTVQPDDPTSPSSYGATIDTGSVSFPLLAGGEFLNSTQAQSSYVYWGISNPVVDHTYTLTLNVNAPAAVAGASYKPYVGADATSYGSGAPATGPTAAFADSLLGGTFTYSAATDVQWWVSSGDSAQVSLGAVIPPTPPKIHAGVWRSTSASPDPSVDSISASNVGPAIETWQPYLLNVGSSVATAPQISLDTSSQTFTPAVTFPYSEGPGADLNHFDAFSLAGLDGGPGHSSVRVASATAGFDSSRSFDVTTIPSGGGTQTVTVSLTNRTATGTPYIDVQPQAILPGATIVPGSAVAPSADPNGSADLSVAADGSDAYWSMNAPAVPGTTYTLTVRIAVPNPDASGLVYKPAVSLGLDTTTLLGAGADGPSTTITDPVLGGTFTFTIGNADARWTQRYLLTDSTLALLPLASAVVPVDHFGVHAPANVSAGVPFTLTVNALNASNNPVQAYDGPVTLTDTSGTLHLVSAVTWDHGTGTASAVVDVPYLSDRISAADAGGSPSATGTSGLIQVLGPLDHFQVRLSTASPAVGAPFQVTVTALDAVGHTVTSYTGPDVLTDASGALAVSDVGTWVAGVDTATVSVGAPYANDVIVASDTSGLTSATGASGYLDVLGAVDHFMVAVGPNMVGLGVDTTLRVTAKDSGGNTVASYAGPVSVSDDLGSVGVDGSFSWAGGVGQAPISFGLPGRTRVTVTDGSGLPGPPTGISGYVAVYGPVDHFTVGIAPNSVASGAATTLTIRARDAANATVTSYAGPVALADLSGTLAADGPISWSNGVGTVPVQASTPWHADTVTATDASGAPGTPAGTSNVFNVTGPVTQFRVAVGSANVGAGADQAVTVTALDALGDTVVGYAGSLTVTDLNGSPPTVSTPFAWTNGIGRGAVAVATPTHLDRLTVADSSLPASGQSTTFNVFGAVAVLKVQVSPANTTVGTPVTVTVTAVDSLGDVVATYAGPVTYTDRSHTVSGGYDQAWSGGVGRAHVPVTAPQPYDTITATDGTHSGTSGKFNVS